MLKLDLLKRDEGFRAYAYQDHLGYWTIGYGRMIDKAKGGGISREEAEHLLWNDVRQREDVLMELFPWYLGLSEVRQAVLLSMAFQLGISGLLAFKNTLRAVQEGRFDDAADGMMRSKWATQTPGRAFRLSEAMRTNDEAALRLSEDL